MSLGFGGSFVSLLVLVSGLSFMLIPFSVPGGTDARNHSFRGVPVLVAPGRLFFHFLNWLVASLPAV